MSHTKAQLVIEPAVAAWLQVEKLAWLTTVRSDGTPLPTPIWFLWCGDHFLLFSEPDALKVRNIRRNRRVAIHFNTDPTGEIFAVFIGEAISDPAPVSAAERTAYVEKYRHGLAMIGVTAAEHAQRWSTVIRIRPDRVRAQIHEPTGTL
ncbi:MAG: TIGR03667 family PPOX class F420-dependent oxidoreductase [Caldilineaceae bacterium]|nr:TIGR03667 family PPOX class F420-dependent oxidoreductase [Caldilineaceae bacterium]